MKTLVIALVLATLSSSVNAAPRRTFPCQKEALKIAQFVSDIGNGAVEGYRAIVLERKADETPNTYVFKVEIRNAQTNDTLGRSYEIVMDEDYRSEACVLSFMK